MAKAPRTGVVLTGNRELDRKMKAIPFEIQQALVKKATRAAQKEVVKPGVESDVPYDEGDLARMIKIRGTKGRRNRFQFGHAVVTARDGFYGAFLEFGTKLRFFKTRGGGTGFIPEGVYKFMRHNLYDNEVRIRFIFIRTLRAWIRQYGERKSTKGRLLKKFIDPPEDA